MTQDAAKQGRSEGADRHPEDGNNTVCEKCGYFFSSAGDCMCVTIPKVREKDFQAGVDAWMEACFGAEISADKVERGDRFAEEAIELLQSGGYDRNRISALTEYVYSREVGEPHQEVGGVMVTLAAYCSAHGLDLHKAADDELNRIWTKVEKIRAKQAAKPTGSALPQEWEPISDGRPCNTDRFLAALLEEGFASDIYQAAYDWVHGDWDAALEYLSEEKRVELLS